MLLLKIFSIVAFVAVAVSVFVCLKDKLFSKTREQSTEFPGLPEFPSRDAAESSGSEEEEMLRKIYDDPVDAIVEPNIEQKNSKTVIDTVEESEYFSEEESLFEEIYQEKLSDPTTTTSPDFDEDDIRATATKLGIPLVDIAQVKWREDLIILFNEELISQYRILPFFTHGDRLFVAAAGFINPDILAELQLQTKMTVEIVLAEAEKLDEALKRALELFDESAELFLEGIEDGEMFDECALTSEIDDSVDGSDFYNELPIGNEKYQHFNDSSIKNAREQPISTFGIDVNTGSYSNVRRLLQSGHLPQKDAVRVEEMINYFDYDYPIPKTPATPFKVTTEIAPAPWNPNLYVLSIGIKGYNVAKSQLLPANLVFLLDVSGSMNWGNRLGSLKSALLLLMQQLTEKDSIAIITYADTTTLVLESTPGDKKAKIQLAINSLVASGSTNGGEGLQLAYSIAKQSFIPNGINRILMGTDGDFNQGTVDVKSLTELVEEGRNSGISLTTLGFGEVNYNDHLMKELAYAGGGSYAYIDTLHEAQKVLIDQISSTLQVIAQDVKIQIEFNPAQVAEYRLIGYENRALKQEDFKNDQVHAGNIGAGHAVTALYELALVGSSGQRLEPLRYADKTVTSNHEHSDELAFLQLRYKMPGGETSELLGHAIYRTAVVTSEQASERFRFAAAVAALGQLLRGNTYLGTFSYADIVQLAQEARGTDEFGYRAEFIQFVNLAKSISSIIK